MDYTTSFDDESGSPQESSPWANIPSSSGLPYSKSLLQQQSQSQLNSQSQSHSQQLQQTDQHEEFVKEDCMNDNSGGNDVGDNLQDSSRESSKDPFLHAESAVDNLHDEVEDSNIGETKTHRISINGPDNDEPVSKVTKPSDKRDTDHRITTSNYTAPRLQAKVTSLERMDRKNPIIRFDVYTNLPNFRTTQYRDISRTHVEFIRLAEHLGSANPEAFVPAVPPSSSSAGIGTSEDEQRVKSWMQRWLNLVFSNAILMNDTEIMYFVETDFGYSPVMRPKPPATGMRRKMLKQFAPPPDPSPELLSARPRVKLFHLAVQNCANKLERLIKYRRGLGLAETELGVELAHTDRLENHAGLANAFKRLGKVIEITGDLHAAQGTAEATTLGDTLNYTAENAYLVKETLTNRQIFLREHLHAQKALRAKLTAADRLKTSTNVRRSKVDEAIAALEEARGNESQLAVRNQRITTCLIGEYRSWVELTCEDLSIALREYVMRQIEAERHTLARLESVRPDVRSIDASGGLSRLGRNVPADQRRINLANSQGPKGDAWSGIPRRKVEGSSSRPISALGIGSSSHDGQVGEVGEANCGSSIKGNVRGMSGGSIYGVIGNSDDNEDKVDARSAVSRLATTVP